MGIAQLYQLPPKELFQQLEFKKVLTSTRDDHLWNLPASSYAWPCWSFWARVYLRWTWTPFQRWGRCCHHSNRPRFLVPSRLFSSLRMRFVRGFVPVDSCETVFRPCFFDFDPGRDDGSPWIWPVSAHPFATTSRRVVDCHVNIDRFLSLSLSRCCHWCRISFESRISNWHFCAALGLSRGLLIVFNRPSLRWSITLLVHLHRSRRHGSFRPNTDERHERAPERIDRDSRKLALASRLTADW